MENHMEPQDMTFSISELYKWNLLNSDPCVMFILSSTGVCVPISLMVIPSSSVIAT
jgi:hypothetical protein